MQRRLSNGTWFPVGDREQEFLNMAAEYHDTTPDQIRDWLDQSQEVRHRGDDWYPHIRYTPKPRKVRATKWVHADCGHSVAKGSLMNASMGTSCPMCYDRMSD